MSQFLRQNSACRSLNSAECTSEIFLLRVGLLSLMPVMPRSCQCCPVSPCFPCIHSLLGLFQLQLDQHGSAEAVKGYNKRLISGHFFLIQFRHKTLSSSIFSKQTFSLHSCPGSCSFFILFSFLFHFSSRFVFSALLSVERLGLEKIKAGEKI